MSAARGLTRTPRSTVRRLPARASYDRAVVDAILDEALVSHVGIVDGGQPFVLPAGHWRMGDRLLLHGAATSRLMQALAAGEPACVTVTLLDGLVLARSAFHHAMNYRSVVLLGRATAVHDPAEKRAALAALLEHVLPGRSTQARAPSARELDATLVVAFPIEEATAKLRTGPPLDDPEDVAQACWAGVVPLRLEAGEPEPDAQLRPGLAPPRVARRRR